jgi:hypothetical protein
MDRDVNASFYAVWRADNADTVFEVSFDMMAECLDSDALPRELDFMTNKQSKEADRDADARRARRPHNEEGMGEHGDEGVEPDFSDLPGGESQLCDTAALKVDQAHARASASVWRLPS